MVWSIYEHSKQRGKRPYKSVCNVIQYIYEDILKLAFKRRVNPAHTHLCNILTLYLVFPHQMRNEFIVASVPPSGQTLESHHNSFDV